MELVDIWMDVEAKRKRKGEVRGLRRIGGEELLSSGRRASSIILGILV